MLNSHPFPSLCHVKKVVFTWILFVLYEPGLRLPEEQGDIEGEGGEEAHVEQHDHNQIPLPGYPLPVNLLLQLKILKTIR